VTGTTAVEELAPLDHDVAMTLAEAEYGRVLALAGELSPQEWERPTDCTGWSVRDVVGHMLGMVELQADPAELRRQIGIARERAQESPTWSPIGLPGTPDRSS
jgi:uncharacterized protein (TIGR03083 family)